MKCRMLFVLVVFVFVQARAQNPAIDTLKARLSRAATPADKVDLLSKLAKSLLNINPAEAERYADLMTREAEMSRNRQLMAKALLSNGERNSYLSFRKENLEKSISYYQQALDLARKNDLDKEAARAYVGLGYIHAKIPELEKSFNYAAQALGIASNLKEDTLIVSAYNLYGSLYQQKTERILALRNYLSALRTAEEAKNHYLMRTCYANLSGFYAEIKEFDKAIDFAQRSMEQLALYSPENEKYLRTMDIFSLGQLYMYKKDFQMSAYYYERSIQLADSLKFQQLKMPAYEGLLQQYVQAQEPRKALEFLNTRQEFREYTKAFHTEYFLDGSYAAIYSAAGMMDSARYYFQKAEPVYEKQGAPNYKLGFYYQYANYFKKTGSPDKAIEYFNRAKLLADQSSNLELQQLIVKELDTMYYRKGDYRQSYAFNSLYHQYKDSLQKLGEEKDLLQMELADEQQREARQEREKEAALREKHNIQYMGITIGIATVFLLLVALGIFQVSEATIRVLGFFAFIFLFEFIILIADNKIHDWTHGEPLPVLGIKIILIAMLLPLHHWLEHRVVHYLASKRLILPRRGGLWSQLRRKGETVES